MDTKIQVYSIVDWKQTPEIVLAQAAKQRQAFGWTGRTLEDFAGLEWCAYNAGKYDTLSEMLHVPQAGEWNGQPALILGDDSRRLSPYVVTNWTKTDKENSFPVIAHFLLWSEVPDNHKVMWMLHWAQACDQNALYYQAKVENAQRSKWERIWVDRFSGAAAAAADRAVYWRNMARVQAGSPYAEPIVEPVKKSGINQQPVQLALF